MAVRGTLQSSGQNCAVAERFYVHKDIYTAFITQVTKIVKSVSAVSALFSVFLVPATLVFSFSNFLLLSY